MTFSKNETVENDKISQDNYWQNMHAELQDLLAGYADNELNAEQLLRVEAHLSGCVECRNDLARQQILATHIETLPAENLSNIAQQRILQALSESKEVNHQAEKAWYSLTYWQVLLNSLTANGKIKSRLITSSGWFVAATFLVMLLPPAIMKHQTIIKPQAQAIITKIPMINDVLLQYQRIQQQNLPQLHPEITRSVHWQGGKVLASWATDVGGAPAQAFAIRYNNQVILQVEIDQQVFFRNADVRQAVAKSGLYRSTNNNTEVLVIPTTEAGIIIVGPVNKLPERDNIIES